MAESSAENVTLSVRRPSTTETLDLVAARYSARRADGTRWCTGVECVVQVRQSRWKGYNAAPFFEGRGLRVDLAMVLARPRHSPGDCRCSGAPGGGHRPVPRTGSDRLGRLPKRSKAGPCSAGCETTRQSGRGQAAGEPSEEAKPGGRAGEATAEPAATEAAPRSVRLRPTGVRSNRSG
jgi:hypothetical protein